MAENRLMTKLVKNLAEMRLEGKMDGDIQENSLDEDSNGHNGFYNITIADP